MEKESMVEELKKLEKEKYKESKRKKSQEYKEKKEESKEQEEIKEIKEIEKKGDFLVPLDDYIKSGIYIGTKVITSYMSKYIFRRRADGLAIINTNETDNRLKLAANLLSQYEPNEIVFTCKREGGWKGAELFGKLTGIKVFTKKYPAGIITNTNLPEFFEPSIVCVADPWLDKSPLADALKLNLPVISLCDTNNLTTNIDLVVPCNNKSGKSLGLIFYILAREYLKNKKIKAELPPAEDFMDIEQ